MNPLVSVVINTYNYGRFIEETIESALAQDYPPERMEIIVVDDGSTDDTPDRIRKYEGRIRYFRTRNGDQCSAVTFGVGQAQGDLLALLDGDDLWLPNKLSRVAEEFAKDPRVVMIYHRYVFWDCRDNTVWEPEDPSRVSGDILADRRKLLAYCAPPTSSLVFRRDAFQPLTRIPLDRVFNYDSFLTDAVPFLGPVACIPEVLAKNRVHGTNIWVAGREGPDEQTIRRRIARWSASTEILREWIWANAPRSFRRQARIRLRCRQLFQEQFEFMLRPPGRWRFFRFQLRKNRLNRGVCGPKLRAINWFNAIASLATGYEGFEALQGWWLRLDQKKEQLFAARR